MADNKKIFTEFPPVSTKEWEDKIEQDLKGADYDKRLIWRTLEGFNVKPYYRSEDLETLKYLDTYPDEFPFIRGNRKDNNNWFVRQDIVVENFEKSNKKALEILMKGVDSLGFVFREKYEYSQDDMFALLDNIKLDAIEINFVLQSGTHRVLEQF